MVQMIVHHKWFIRLALAVFWVVEIIADAYGYGFLTAIATSQPLILFIIVFVTVKYLMEPFYAPFVKLTTDGGETVMERSTQVMLIVVGLAITFSILMLWDVSRTFIIQTLFIDTVLANIYLAVLAFESWLTNFSPLWVVTGTFIAALIFAILVNTFVRPRVPFRQASSQPKHYEWQEQPSTQPQPIAKRTPTQNEPSPVEPPATTEAPVKEESV